MSDMDVVVAKIKRIRVRRYWGSSRYLPDDANILTDEMQRQEREIETVMGDMDVVAEVETFTHHKIGFSVSSRYVELVGVAEIVEWIWEVKRLREGWCVLKQRLAWCDENRR